MNKYFPDNEEKKRLYDTPGNRRLKYAALSVAGAVIILLLSRMIWTGEISQKDMIIMRGCAGLGAIIFMVITGVLVYRVNKQHIENVNKQYITKRRKP